MKPRPIHLRGEKGMASVAVLIFSIVAVLILVANFKLNYAVGQSSDAFDSFNSQTVEKNGVAQIVKESILSILETATAASVNPIQTEIQNRLSSMTFPAGVSVTLASAPNLPTHPFFPTGAPLAAAQPSYFSTAPRGIAGMGALFTSLAIQGPAADMGRLTYTFSRTSTNAPGEAWTYTVNADLFSVPLTNVDVVAYGLPSSGAIPTQAPLVPPGTFAAGVSCLVVTSNNPANDPTSYPDLYASAGPERLPYEYRNAISFSWNAYEFLWSLAYQHALLNFAGAEADPGNTTTPGALYDFSSGANPTIAGVTEAGSSVTINCQAVQSQVIAIVDSEGTGTVNITGSPVSGSPFVLLVRNTAGAQGRTQVNFSGSNSRPVIFYLENSNVIFTGSPQVEGALFLDPTTVAAGAVAWFGHFSFYGPASPLATLNIGINDSPAVKGALAALAPRVLMVSTTSTRQ